MLFDLVSKLTPNAGAFGSGLLITIILLEIPRYLFLSFAAMFHRTNVPVGDADKVPFSLVIVGHNEAERLRRCFEGLAEQSHRPSDVVVVSDGSTDAMHRELRALRREGKIKAYHHLDLRGGKAAALNLALQSCREEIVICVDADTVFERHAFRNIVAKFAQTGCGAASGNIRAANATANLLTEVQDIEYQVRISAGKRGLDLIGQVSLISGAFGAFRKSALRDVGGFDPVSGEDLDLTLRLRRAGYRICFAQTALCHTRVPTTSSALIKQRYRWERDAFALRLRQHRSNINPGSAHFRAREIINFLDFFLFDFLSVMIFPFFYLYLGYFVGDGLWHIALIYLCVYGACDLLIFLLGRLHEQDVELRQIFVLPAYIIYHLLLLRILRFLAYGSEWFFHASSRDDFVPDKVRVATGYKMGHPA